MNASDVASQAYRDKLAQEKAADDEAKKVLADLGIEDEVAKDPQLEAKLKAKDEQDAKDAAQKAASDFIVAQNAAKAKETIVASNVSSVPPSVPKAPNKYAPPGSVQAAPRVSVQESTPPIQEETVTNAPAKKYAPPPRPNDTTQDPIGAPAKKYAPPPPKA